MQRAFSAAVLTAALIASPALAQAPAPSAPIPGFNGYGHPAIGPGDCKALNANQAQCIVPARTAGRYLIDGAGTSTATGAGAQQSIVIGGPTWQCAQATNHAPWSSGPRTFRVQCVVTVLTDEPLAVNMLYRDANATKDPKGPVLRMAPVPWNGVLDVHFSGAK
ncbi:MAG TPA: hypothetical protein VHZ26_00010 [Caulobacteraceae bacterium]|jgi:hypothetical protein|nr:hypothetical protein [Caulobacteraceae bacterium]